MTLIGMTFMETHYLGTPLSNARCALPYRRCIVNIRHSQYIGRIVLITLVSLPIYLFVFYSQMVSLLIVINNSTKDA